MSRLDFAMQEVVLRETNEVYKDSADIAEKSLYRGGAVGLNKFDLDLEAWLQVFKDDLIMMDCCTGR